MFIPNFGIYNPIFAHSFYSLQKNMSNILGQDHERLFRIESTPPTVILRLLLQTYSTMTHHYVPADFLNAVEKNVLPLS